ncbi:MAG: helix-turn-helix domain-containing protein [Bacillota bacterium]|nr:helix-turn-helix domain-containing protein [Bacillota bacterium]MDD3298758.1 helix-turn-helix domain-containing protein [Bacillota bacterium]MDD3850888.1 helix-turn-helix domain-containing protein [Bacillota bacterium]MDD4707844.1 helix-turn-helix domain-containing protein [Bacillota bacterium]
MDDKKRLSISQVSEITGYKTHVIRFYEKEFDLVIPRNKSGHRCFTYKEVETLKYIKQLQEKGLTNSQIKVILKTPEVMLEGNDEVKEIAVAGTSVIGQDYSQQRMQEFIKKYSDEIREGLMGVSENLKDLTDEIRAKDKDVLICENAKLKMDMKRKAYEVAELKEQLKREKNRKKTLLGKLFYK